tara:strand:- start:1766 stop:2281 length:516 start_codon:yes stop_codon:yes gene_type:complete
MKKIYFLIVIISFSISCNKKGNGYVENSDLSFHLGTNDAVKLFQSFDNYWKNLDYQSMKEMIADSISFEFHDGKIATNPDEFFKIIKDEVEKDQLLGNNYSSWTTDFAYSVDLNPSSGGEWVNAGFTSSLDSIQNGVIKKIFNEWYFFNEEKKLELWYQSLRIVKDKDLIN